jgi:hypothetical protein
MYGQLQPAEIARAVAALSVVYFHSKAALDPFPKDTAYPISWLTSVTCAILMPIAGIYGLIIFLGMSDCTAIPASLENVSRIFAVNDRYEKCRRPLDAGNRWPGQDIRAA